MPDGKIFTADLPAYWPSGYFWAKVYFADTVLLEDRFPFSKHGPMHRVRLNGDTVLTVPARYHSGQTAIHQVPLAGPLSWTRKHAATIAGTYAWLPQFDYLFPEIQPLYDMNWNSVSDFLFQSIRYLKNIWRIQARIFRSSDVWSAPLPDDYKLEWFQRFGFQKYVVYEGEKQYVLNKNESPSWQWSEVVVSDADFARELHNNSLYLLMRYGIDFPGLVQKYCQLSEIL